MLLIFPHWTPLEQLETMRTCDKGLATMLRVLGFPYLQIKRLLGFGLLFSWFQTCLCFQKIFVTYYQNSISCFLIDNSYPSFCKCYLTNRHHFSILICTKYNKTWSTKTKTTKLCGRRLSKTLQLSIFQILRYENHILKDDSIPFLIFFEAFW